MRFTATIILTALIILPFLTFSQGQNLEDEVKTIKKFKPASISFTIGGYEDHYQNLTMAGLQSMIGSQDNLSSYLDSEYEANYFTAIIGSNLGVYFSLNPYSRKKMCPK